MADYINREVTLKILTRIADCVSDSRRRAVTRCIREIASLAPANVEPVRHGRWMHEETEGGFHIWSCSRCGRGMNGNPNGTNLYCYHCGAKMDLI